MILATFALFISVTHISIGPFETQKPVEQTIAETAAKRVITGEPAIEKVEHQSKLDFDFITTIATITLAAGAMLLAIIAFVRREEKTFAYVGFYLGAGVLLMAWLQWIALIICGVIILAAIINNLDSILPS